MSPKVNASWRFVLLTLLISLLMLHVPANAQMGNATLSGTVTDTSGAAVVGVQLSLINKAQQFEQKAYPMTGASTPFAISRPEHTTCASV